LECEKTCIALAACKRLLQSDEGILFITHTELTMCDHKRRDLSIPSTSVFFGPFKCPLPVAPLTRFAVRLSSRGSVVFDLFRRIPSRKPCFSIFVDRLLVHPFRNIKTRNISSRQRK